MLSGNFFRCPVVLQSTKTDCGVACATSILLHFGFAVDVADLRKDCMGSESGTPIANLKSALIKRNLEAKVFQRPVEVLAAKRCPHILFWDSSHFVILNYISNGRAFLMDPVVGEREMPVSQLEEYYTGVCLEANATSFRRKKGVSNSGFRQANRDLWPVIIPALVSFCTFYTSFFCLTIFWEYQIRGTSVSPFFAGFLGFSLSIFALGFILLLALLLRLKRGGESSSAIAASALRGVFERYPDFQNRMLPEEAAARLGFWLSELQSHNFNRSSFLFWSIFLSVAALAMIALDMLIGSVLIFFGVVLAISRIRITSKLVEATLELSKSEEKLEDDMRFNDKASQVMIHNGATKVLMNARAHHPWRTHSAIFKIDALLLFPKSLFAFANVACVPAVFFIGSVLLTDNISRFGFIASLVITLPILLFALSETLFPYLSASSSVSWNVEKETLFLEATREDGK